MNYYKPIISVIAIFIVFLLIWALWWEPASLQVREYKIAPPNWSSKTSSIRIAVLADLHTGSPYHGLAMLNRIVKETNKTTPDLILLAGDFVIHGVVGGSFIAPEQSAKRLSALKARLGVYAVLGNHDWWLDRDQVYKALTDNGITVLEDQAILLPTIGNSSPVWLAGISDYWEGAHDIDKALHDVPSTANLIVFTHNPDIFPEIPSRVHLTIAGHTHGGQVKIPFFGTPIVPSQYGQRYAAGHIVEDNKHLFVTPGLGTSIVPVRFRVPPEISLLTVSFK